MEILKKKRRVIRAQATRIINEADHILAKQATAPDMVAVSGLIERLLLVQNQLSDVNAAIEPHILEEDADAEFEQAIEYDDKMASCLGFMKSFGKSLTDGAQIRNLAPAKTTAQVQIQSQRTRLPKFELKKFDGKRKNWQPFWEQFEVAIHNNHELSDIDRFNYLKSLLSGEAEGAIAGLQATAECYADAIEILAQRFGNPTALIQDHMQGLIDLKPVTSAWKVRELRRLYDDLQVHMRGLKVLGVGEDSYNTMLYPVLLRALPQEMVLNYHRSQPDLCTSSTDGSSSAGSAPEHQTALTTLIRYFRPELDSQERALEHRPDNSIGKPAFHYDREKVKPQRSNCRPSSAAALHGTAETEQFPQSRVRLLANENSKEEYVFDALEVPSICEQVIPCPDEQVKGTLRELSLPVGDNSIEQDATIDVLIGSDQFWECLTRRIRKINSKLTAMETVFGWAVQGPTVSKCKAVNCAQVVVLRSSVTDQQTEPIPRFFSELEGVGVSDTPEKLPDVQIMEQFTKGNKTVDGRYEVRLPEREDVAVGDNRSVSEETWHIEQQFENFMPDELDQRGHNIDMPNFWYIGPTGSFCMQERYSATAIEASTGILPPDRTTQADSLEVVGIDFAGTLFGAVTGSCSDVVQTLRHASKELSFPWKAIRHPETLSAFANANREWKFIAKHAPWWGGFYECLVRRVKIALKKAVGRQGLDFVELSTVLAEVGTVINHRPLTQVQDDPNDGAPLTPASFLTGRRLTVLPAEIGSRE
ncbi:hypothetical protein HPB50_008086 [Hyalomma asiaticum]|uniref:Uncharacterized protein n=1 Tax=Hyalomma asiaticum TaxID=266040 RepID=A0ACB7RW63_HYAAI|nr:hypothetical protein HPB50_008086 [Hyalomma asiaticum]